LNHADGVESTEGWRMRLEKMRSGKYEEGNTPR
jgi:hypothetical protein